MECAEIRSIFLAGHVPSGPEAEAHLERCPECRELLADDARLGKQLARAARPEPAPAPDDLLALVERDLQLETGARARLRALPTRVRAGALIALGLLLCVFHLVFRPRPDLASFAPGTLGLTLAVLGAALVLGAARLARGATASLGSLSERALGLTLLGVTALVAFLVPLGAPAQSVALWGHPASCFGYGAALSAPSILLYWLFERRDAPPAGALVAAGALAGVAANLLLGVHCGSAHPGHLLLGHVSIGVAWALGLWLLARPAQLSR